MSITVEETAPLLNTLPLDENPHDAVYRRFSTREKKFILFIVSIGGLLPLFVSGTFVPSIPQIAHDLDSDGVTISLAVSLSIFSTAIGGLIWASYSSFYGRRPIYLWSLPLLVVGSIGVASAHSLRDLFIFRFFQAFGAAGGWALGSGVIGDIYKLEERGTAMGIFFGAALLGPALAPLAGGLAAHYSSWRNMQFILGICGCLEFIFVLGCFPETCHPGTRGIDQVIESRPTKKFKFVWINPLRSLLLLRSPNLLAVTIAGSFVLFTDYVLLVPLAYTVGVRYNITNEAAIGACFLPAGLGNLIGAPLAGRISDIIVKKWRARRDGNWVPEDRLRATYLGGILLVPVSILAFGLITQFVPGKIGLIMNLFCLFCNGLGVDFVLSPSASYGVDVLHSKSAEAMAASGSFRSLFIALGTTVILPLIAKIGVAWTNAIAAGLAWIGCVLIFLTVQYGKEMRAMVDIGYSTLDDT